MLWRSVPVRTEHHNAQWPRSDIALVADCGSRPPMLLLFCGMLQVTLEASLQWWSSVPLLSQTGGRTGQEVQLWTSCNTLETLAMHFSILTLEAFVFGKDQQMTVSGWVAKIINTNYHLNNLGSKNSTSSGTSCSGSASFLPKGSCAWAVSEKSTTGGWVNLGNRLLCSYLSRNKKRGRLRSPRKPYSSW